jgi:hypothetical protein
MPLSSILQLHRGRPLPVLLVEKTGVLGENTDMFMCPCIMKYFKRMQFSSWMHRGFQ